MKQLTAFIKKEWMEQWRTHRFLILLLIFLLFGILSPALAKLTPWLFSMLSQDLEKQGIVIAEMQVDALTSWMQYYKNIGMALLVMAVVFSSVLTNEYQRGTLINMITKGLDRWKILFAKSVVMLFIWTICYWLCFAITYAYNAYFWDNSIAAHVVLAASCIWLFGIWLIVSILFFSTMFRTSTMVLLGIGIVIGCFYLASMLPAAASYMPTNLISPYGLLVMETPMDMMIHAAGSTILCCLIELLLAIKIFNTKKL